ncbi:Mechanosensitive ion channel protein 1, mitochondrial, partial [Dichanthelium oligosanthes]
LGFSGVPSLRRMCSSYTRTKPEGPENSVSKVSSTGASEVGTAVDGGNTWVDMSENAHCSAIDASTVAGKNLKDLNDAVTFHVQELFSNHADLEKVVVPLGGTLIGTAMAWFVMPIVLRKLHKSLMFPSFFRAAVIAPSISDYLPQAWKGAFVVSFVWFLHRCKTNFIANAMAKRAAIGTDRERLSAFDKVSSLGLIALGVVALAEACGVPVQSILTVGGVGGVATAFAARDILGNMLSGLSLQFSRPFSVGDYIKMIVNKSRAQWHVSVAKLPLRTEDIEKISAITEEIKAMLVSNPKIDAPYCYLSRLEGSRGELTIGCNIKGTKTEEWSSIEQDVLLKAGGIMKRHQLWTAM